jgi:hypothetical protein
MVAPQTQEGWLSDKRTYRQFVPEQKAVIVLAGLRVVFVVGEADYWRVGTRGPACGRQHGPDSGVPASNARPRSAVGRACTYGAARPGRRGRSLEVPAGSCRRRRLGWPVRSLRSVPCHHLDHRLAGKTPKGSRQPGGETRTLIHPVPPPEVGRWSGADLRFVRTHRARSCPLISAGPRCSRVRRQRQPGTPGVRRESPARIARVGRWPAPSGS